MNNCVFCKIITGALPATKVYEDDETVAFLDINPVNKGHTLVIPKKHVDSFMEAGTAEIRAVMTTSQRVATAVLLATGAEGFNLSLNNGRAAGQVIFHWHMHLVPRFEHDGLKLWAQGKYEEGEMDELAAKIKEVFK